MSEGLYKALEAAHGPGQANQVSWVGQTAGVEHNRLAHGQYAAYLDPDSQVLSPGIFLGFKARA